MFTSLRLGFLLELDEIISESRAALDRGDTSTEEIRDKQRKDNLKIQNLQKRIECKRWTAIVYTLLVVIVTVVCCITAFGLKKELIDEGDLLRRQAIKIDSMQLVLFIIHAITLIGTLIYFVRLDRRYHMNIKKHQVVITLAFAVLVVANNACQMRSNTGALRLT